MLTLARVRRRFPEATEVPGQRGPEFYVHCPRLHRKGPFNFKLNINAESGAFVCQDCGWAGSAYREWFDGVDELFAHLSAEPLVPLVQDTRRCSAQVLDEWMDGVPRPGRLRALAQLPEDHAAWTYLRSRGFDEAEIRAFGPERALYYCEQGAWTRGGGTNGGRLVFPVYLHGQLKGWQARQIDREVCQDDGRTPSHREVWNGETWLRYAWNPKAQKFEDQVRGIPKYNTCPGMQRSQLFYNFDTALGFGAAVVVEGPLDALRVGPEALGAMGGNGSLSAGQCKLLCACWDAAVLLLDPGVDQESKGHLRTLDALRAIPVTALKLPSGRDPGSTPRTETWQAIQNAFVP